LSKASEKALDEIFGGPPAAFIKGRDALARKLSHEGDPEEAKRIKALRKPSKAASALNALALDDPKSIKRYLGLADKLRKATSGKVDAKRMRELAREEGELLEELVARAGKLGDGASSSTLDRVRETLQAAQVDAELADKVLVGRVEREERAASVGLDNLAGPPVAPSRKKASAKESAPDESSKKEAAARKRRSEAKAELKAAQAEAREAAREVARAEGTWAKAERARDAADGRVERAEAKLEKLG
jgi:hypothetical protein